MPAGLYLQQFGDMVFSVFNSTPFHVGSSVQNKVWRDVDVCVMLDEEEWKKWELGDPQTNHIDNQKFIVLCMAFSELGTKMTGLPIDFKIQPRDWANERFPMTDDEGIKHPRSALGIVPWRFAKSS